LCPCLRLRHLLPHEPRHRHALRIAQPLQRGDDAAAVFFRAVLVELDLPSSTRTGISTAAIMSSRGETKSKGMAS
jgi:hypothetical protein